MALGDCKYFRIQDRLRALLARGPNVKIDTKALGIMHKYRVISDVVKYSLQF